MFNLKSKAARRADAIRRRWCDPTAERHWHKPAGAIQAARIEAAAVKRARRADKLQRDTAFSARNNDAWFTNGAMPVRLNPIHS